MQGRFSQTSPGENVLDVFDEFMLSLKSSGETERRKLQTIEHEYSWTLEATFILFLPYLAIMTLILYLYITRPRINRTFVADAHDFSEVDKTEDLLDETPSSSISHARLISAGLTEEDIRNHSLLGYFYDFVTMEIPDDPALLNTGQIVDENTAETLVRNRSRLPQGNVTGFFRSAAMRNLLNTLVSNEVEKSTAKKYCNSRLL